MAQSDELLLAKHLLQGRVALAGGPHEPRNGHDAGLAEVDGAVGVYLGRKNCTSQIESWMEEWSLEVRMRSVKSHLRGR